MDPRRSPHPPSELRAPAKAETVNASDCTEEDPDGQEASTDQPVPYALDASDGTEGIPTVRKPVPTTDP